MRDLTPMEYDAMRADHMYLITSLRAAWEEGMQEGAEQAAEQAEAQATQR